MVRKITQKRLYEEKMDLRLLKTLIFVTAISLTAASGMHKAAAVTIGNCDDETHSVLANVGGHIEQYILEPGQTRRVLSPTVRLQIGDFAPILTRYHEHYCIWNGRLLIQRKNLRNRHR